jgi:hypothetical protein
MRKISDETPTAVVPVMLDPAASVQDGTIFSFDDLFFLPASAAGGHIHHTQDCLPKTVLNHVPSSEGIPKSPQHLAPDRLKSARLEA